MSDFVKIQSSKTISVTPGLQNMDVTNPDAHVPDRLKVQPTWPNGTILIIEGVGTYPAEIVDWPTVKALVNDGIMTIGEYVDESNPEKVAKAEAVRDNLESIGVKTTRKSKKQTLDEIAED